MTTLEPTGQSSTVQPHDEVTSTPIHGANDQDSSAQTEDVRALRVSQLDAAELDEGFVAMLQSKISSALSSFSVS